VYKYETYALFVPLFPQRPRAQKWRIGMKTMTISATPPPALHITPAWRWVPHRTVFRIHGADKIDFLQGLVSCDVTHVSAQSYLWGAFLTPQGKYLYDFFITLENDAFLLETDVHSVDEFMGKLKKYRLRRKIDIQAAPEWRVFALQMPSADPLPNIFTTKPADADIILRRDQRFASAGYRGIARHADMLAKNLSETFTKETPALFERQRILMGLPDGSRDMIPEKSVLLECGFEELHGVSFDKGCYMGQEVTARTKYRGLVKKKLLPIESTHPLPSGTAIYAADTGKNVGTVRSSVRMDDGLSHGLAFLRQDAHAKPLILQPTNEAEASATLRVLLPPWQPAAL
jgi:folate-binding protein YgfZ